jgi:hypothetical protein
MSPDAADRRFRSCNGIEALPVDHALDVERNVESATPDAE